MHEAYSSKNYNKNPTTEKKKKKEEEENSLKPPVFLKVYPGNLG
jgi:hypothetical protein